MSKIGDRQLKVLEQCDAANRRRDAQGHTPTLGEAALDEINRLNKHIDKLIRNSAELEQERADLLAACKEARVAMAGTDWPIKTRLEAAIAKAEGGVH